MDLEGISDKVEDGEEEVSEVPATSLGRAVNNFLLQWRQIVSQTLIDVGLVQPTPDHIKELAEFSVRQFKDSVLDLNAEFARFAMEWILKHPKEAEKEDIADLEKSIQRQHKILAKYTEQ